MWLSEGVDVFCMVEGIQSVFLRPIFTAGTGQVRSLALVLILGGGRRLIRFLDTSTLFLPSPRRPCLGKLRRWACSRVAPHPRCLAESIAWKRSTVRLYRGLEAAYLR